MTDVQKERGHILVFRKNAKVHEGRGATSHNEDWILKVTIILTIYADCMIFKIDFDKTTVPSMTLNCALCPFGGAHQFFWCEYLWVSFGLPHEEGIRMDCHWPVTALRLGVREALCR